MKTMAYVLHEEQIEWLRQKAFQAGQSTNSAALRRVLREAMEREGITVAFMKPADKNPQSSDQR